MLLPKLTGRGFPVKYGYPQGRKRKTPGRGAGGRAREVGGAGHAPQG